MVLAAGLIPVAGWAATVLEVVLAVGLLVGVRLRAVALASGLLLLALLYFGVNQQFLVQIALLEKQSGWASVQRGRALIDPQWPLLLLLGLIKALLLVLGLVSFGVGLLVVWPVASVITTAAYRQLVRANPQLAAALSSPSAY